VLWPCGLIILNRIFRVRGQMLWGRRREAINASAPCSREILPEAGTLCYAQAGGGSCSARVAVVAMNLCLREPADLKSGRCSSRWGDCRLSRCSPRPKPGCSWRWADDHCVPPACSHCLSCLPKKGGSRLLRSRVQPRHRSREKRRVSRLRRQRADHDSRKNGKSDQGWPRVGAGSALP